MNTITKNNSEVAKDKNEAIFQQGRALLLAQNRQAIPVLEVAANNGNLQAMDFLVNEYCRGALTATNWPRAAHWVLESRRLLGLK